MTRLGMIQSAWGWGWRAVSDSSPRRRRWAAEHGGVLGLTLLASCSIHDRSLEPALEAGSGGMEGRAAGAPGAGANAGAGESGGDGAARAAGEGGVAGASGHAEVAGGLGPGGVAGVPGVGVAGGSGKDGTAGASGQGGDGRGGQGVEAGKGGLDGAGGSEGGGAAGSANGSGGLVGGAGQQGHAGQSGALGSSGGSCEPSVCVDDELREACCAVCGCADSRAHCLEGRCVVSRAVAAGGYVSCASLDTGSVACWGSNLFGELGLGDIDPPITSSSRPRTVSALTDVEEVAVGTTFACARRSDGTVACWGDNTAGQLGNGTLVSSPSPVVVSGLDHAVAIAAGHDFACAVLEEKGNVKCWGGNAYGQLGTGQQGDYAAEPAEVADLVEVSQVVGGHGFACARVKDGTVHCWGTNNDGQLGDGTRVASPVPTTADGLPAARAIAATCDASPLSSAGAPLNGTGLAVLADGAVRWWGSDILTGTRVEGLQVQSNLPAVDEAAGGNDFFCARTATGSVYCWGTGAFGQLGNGQQTSSPTPLQVPDLTSAVDLAAGSYHACVLTSGGAVKCWGYNGAGQLGVGSYENSSAPVEVQW